MIESDIFSGTPVIRHGFFTREGGVSDGIYGSLNCGAGSSDLPENVIENKRRAAARIGVAGDRLVTLYQVHSARVVQVSDPDELVTERPEADAMVTDRPDIALGILTADCAPVLFADPVNRVIGAAHAGWKGALAGVVENTVAAMENLGASRGEIRACVGPCIAQDSYQVGAEFPAPFLDQDPGSETYFNPDPEPGKHRFDLRGYVMSRLAGAGIAEFTAVEMDTYSLEDLFFSYRRTCHRGEDDYGRGLSAIALGR